ncbi:MAG: hypothetical protein ACTJGR_04885 [Pauljensenia sp.]
MWSYLGAMTLLGGLGFDPGPMIISVGALSLGARRRNILLFATALVLGTTAWGVALTLVAGPAIRHVHWLALAESPLGLGVAAVAAGVLLVWGILTLRRRLTPRGPGGDPDRARQETRTASHIAAGPLPLLLVALFFVAIVLSDPPFPAGVVLSSHRPVPEVVLGFLVWALVSQSPLVLLAGALVTGLGERFIALTRRAMTRIAPVATLAAAGAAVVGGVVLGIWVVARLVG